jgi:hypothetical protein
VDSRVTGKSLIVAASAIAILASGMAGCSSGGNSAAKSTATAARPLTPQQSIQLAARTTSSVNSFVGTLSASITAPSGTGDITGTFTEQLHPSLLARVDISTFDMAGQSLPGGISEIVTANSFYLKLGMLTQALHTSKPWIEIPFSAINKATGVNLGALFSQLQTSSPLTQTMMFAGATNVRTVGTGTVDGVPVTEYNGTISMTDAMAKLPASLRASMGQQVQKAGISSMRFTAWVDGQHIVRKEIINETGSSFAETMTITIGSINQPVSIQVPPASQTTALPASVLNSSGVNSSGI